MTNDLHEEEPITTELGIGELRTVPLKSDRRPVLVSLSGELIATPIPLERDIVVFGRALEADIRLNDSKASRLHARIEMKDGTSFRIKDLGSTNGTLVNGQVVKDAALKDGDKILIGDHLFRFDLQDEIDREFQQRIHRLIGHDHLTGLLTSKSFFTELRREASRAEEQQKPFGVLMMDVDHFKDVNDKFGHLAGSRTLQELGALIKKALRSGDVAARFGGEEFAAFLLEANYAQAVVAGERVRRFVNDHTFSAPDHDSEGKLCTFNITVSIGVAAYPDDGTDPIKLIELADSALYRAKRAGRNQVCAYRPSLATIEGPMPSRQR
jgi:diguanylate cyclase (GGDEF)-like protein